MHVSSTMMAAKGLHSACVGKIIFLLEKKRHGRSSVATHRPSSTSFPRQITCPYFTPLRPLDTLKVWKGSTGTACVKALEPARGYRFRVRAVNCEGQEGAASESMVSLLLRQPPPLFCETAPDAAVLMCVFRCDKNLVQHGSGRRFYFCRLP